MALTKITGQVVDTTTDLVVGVTTVGGGVSAVDGFFSGIVTFSQGVSIGGTLTYEDVTNIDSVGLITARAGVVVGSGITLSKDGDVFFTGIATGNGSGLTALNASNISSGTVPTARLGSGTASSSTFLRGDSTFQTVNTDLVSDTSLQLGGNLDVNGKNIIFGDSSDGDGDDVLKFGAGTDLKIWHSGTNSYIRDSGTGGLRINSDAFYVNNAAENENMIRAFEDGAVELYYDNSKKFETTSYGNASAGQLRVTSSNASTVAFSVGDQGTGFYNTGSNAIGYAVNGTQKWNINSGGHLTLLDSVELQLGTSSDLQIFHDGSQSIIRDVGTGSLMLQGSQVIMESADGGEVLAKFIDDGSVELYHDNSMKLQTLADGYSVVGSIFGGIIQSPVPSNITFNSNSFTPAAMFYPEGGYGNNGSPSNNRQCLIVGNTKGNWNDGNSSTTHRSNGLRFSRIISSTEKLRAGIAHDIQGIEKFKFWTSYGDIHFRTRNGNDGDQTWEECDKDPLVLHHNGHVSMCNMPRLYWTLAQSASSYSNDSGSYTVTGGSATTSHGMSINTGTGVITIPYAGVYMVNASIGLHSNSSTNQRLDMRIGGAEVVRTEQHSSTGWHTHHIHVAYPFSANDSVDFKVIGRTDAGPFSHIDITLLHGTATT